MPFTQAGGVRIAYDAQGHGDAVVFVHEPDASRAVWAPQLAELGRHYRAIALDLRGHGDSDTPVHPTPDAEALDINAVFDAERLARAHLVGGEAALQFALAFPARVRSLTLTGPRAAELPSERLSVPSQRLSDDIGSPAFSGKLRALLAELRP